MRPLAWLMLTAGTLLAAPVTRAADAPKDPDARLRKGAETIEKTAATVRSLRADYVKTYLVEGRADRLREKGVFSWKRTAGGAWARWEGKDEKGPILTLVRDGALSVWRGKRKESSTPLKTPALRHASKYGFPLLPPKWSEGYRVANFRTSPEYDDRLPAWSPKGIPAGLVFQPAAKNKSALKAVTFQFDADTGLAYRLRCDTYLWEMFWVDLGEWELNPELPDTLFAPPDRLAEKGDKPKGNTP